MKVWFASLCGWFGVGRGGRVRATCVLLCLVGIVALASRPLHASVPASGDKWVVTWAQPMTSNYTLPGHVAYKPWEFGVQYPPPRVPSARDVTLRQTVLASIGGRHVRIRLSNYFGQKPVTVDAAHIALGANGAGKLATIVPASDRTLTFDGKRSLTIAPGHAAMSDPVALDVPRLSRVVVSLYFAQATDFADVHPLEPVDTAAVVKGDAVAARTFAGRKRLDVLGKHSRRHVYLLSGVDVMAPAATRVVVAFGDSITDGAYAKALADPWPEALAHIADRQSGEAPAAVVNEGISGNELTTDQIGRPDFGMSGLKRFERDVIEQPGVTDVIVLLGTNDINRGIGPAGYPTGASAGDLIASLSMLADVAHQHHLRIFVGTVPPMAGFRAPGWYTPQKEAVRERVNRWIRHTTLFDGTIPFSHVLQGTYKPSPLAAQQTPLPPGIASVCTADGGLHPDDRGYVVMAAAAYDVLFHGHLKPRAPCDR